MFEIELRHNFETAHRLSTDASPEKCRSIHGHSWWVTVRIEGDALDDDGILVEFGAFKSAWRRWLDDTLDHHLVLASKDPLVPILRDFDATLRVCLLDENPTTEVLARHIARHSQRILTSLGSHVRARVARVYLQETRVNAATFVVPR